MESIIGTIISLFGFYIYGMDFCTLYTFISISIAIYKTWQDHTNKKTALK